eukprot:scaffold3785_cov115-Isochrysis_galbana.AAC.1
MAPSTTGSHSGRQQVAGRPTPQRPQTKQQATADVLSLYSLQPSVGLKRYTLRASGDSAGHPVPKDPSALTLLPHYLPESRQNRDNYRRKRPVGSQWEP